MSIAMKIKVNIIQFSRYFSLVIEVQQKRTSNIIVDIMNRVVNVILINWNSFIDY